ncbi:MULTISPECIES: LysR substrate-binding domain-containing protein [unclassified Streptomyces]|uniref:LysR family transcriptional regulator n=1 Tax=Streptomycetaceae TaxID=2062 RepID=UPI002E765A19|nr:MULTISPECIES: LysR substrate-binding domain-containing protein [unclassified Streptomyces]MED7954110.1 LysR substrate-binding domain-containing protein [Streptomyces sp. BE303]MEE1825941.1 LysR substrate-binding domain-containing protein [Streptomyces sp. BE20]
MLDVRRLRLLRELAHLGTIAAVAEALSFSPSAVSQQLSVLEKEAGVPLLERTGRRVALTPAGLNLVRHAEAVLERLEQADAELAHAREGLAGPLRIGTYPSAARAIIPALLAELAGWHPGLEPMVTEVDPAAVAAALRAGELDVALVHEYDLVPADPEPGLAVTRPVFTEPMYLAARGPGSVADQRTEPWILAPAGTLCHTMAVRACESAGFAPRIRHQIDDFATVLALVAAGQGVALVPHLGTAEPPPGVTLTRLPMYRRTRTAFRAGAGAHPAISAFVSALYTAVPPGLRGSA